MDAGLGDELLEGVGGERGGQVDDGAGWAVTGRPRRWRTSVGSIVWVRCTVIPRRDRQPAPAVVTFDLLRLRAELPQGNGRGVAEETVAAAEQRGSRLRAPALRGGQTDEIDARM